MFDICRYCGTMYLLKSSRNKCEVYHQEKKIRKQRESDFYILTMQETIKRHSEVINLLGKTSMSNSSYDQRRREEERRRRSRSSTPTSNSVLDGTIYTGGYSDYSSHSSSHHSSDSNSYDSGSSSCDSSSSSSCD